MNLPELGAFLQSRRARITPTKVGLPAGPRRRVPGLRRDEVARLAGASVDYYIELERGRGAQPSTQMLAALARALRLDGDLDVHCQNLFSEDGRQRLQFFTAPAGSPALEQLRLLAVIGIQELADGPTDSVVNPMP